MSPTDTCMFFWTKRNHSAPSSPQGMWRSTWEGVEAPDSLFPRGHLVGVMRYYGTQRRNFACTSYCAKAMVQIESIDSFFHFVLFLPWQYIWEDFVYYRDFCFCFDTHILKQWDFTWQSDFCFSLFLSSQDLTSVDPHYCLPNKSNHLLSVWPMFLPGTAVCPCWLVTPPPWFGGPDSPPLINLVAPKSSPSVWSILAMSKAPSKEGPSKDQLCPFQTVDLHWWLPSAGFGVLGEDDNGLLGLRRESPWHLQRSAWILEPLWVKATTSLTFYILKGCWQISHLTSSIYKWENTSPKKFCALE